MEATTPILAGLIRKRQEIAGELETAYGRVAALTDSLRSLDDTIRLFGPETQLEEIAPKQRRYVAQPGEIVFQPAGASAITLQASPSEPTRVLVLGGEPFGEQIVM